MKQTPPHDIFNESILSLLPQGLKKVVEVGCMRGSLGKEYIRNNPECKWIGIDIDANNVEIAKEVCYDAFCADIEKLSDEELNGLFPADFWIFGDVLEHLRDPWLMLRRLRKIMTKQESIIACIPNSQHWSFQARVNAGQFRYENEGLFDRTHLRFFSRITILEMFTEAGFHVDSAVARSWNFPGSEKYMPHIRAMAAASGVDPDQAEDDSMAFQFVVRAVPV